MTSPDTQQKETPSQTAGPYVHIGLAPAHAGLRPTLPDLGAVPSVVEGSPLIEVRGTVRDGAGARVNDVLIEVWQADAAGRYAEPAETRTGWARVIPDFETGIFSFRTVKPGAVQTPTGQRLAPHLCLWLVARGINIGLHTRMYFPEDAALHDADPALCCITDARRRETLIAQSTKDHYQFDIVLQGANETVFFDF